MIVFNYPFFLVLSLLYGGFFLVYKKYRLCCASLVIENPQIIGAIKIFERDAARLVVPLFLSIGIISISKKFMNNLKGIIQGEVLSMRLLRTLFFYTVVLIMAIITIMPCMLFALLPKKIRYDNPLYY